MATGISLHIGLNAVDPDQYEGWSGDLTACEFDAKDMASLAKKQGFVRSDILLTRKATSASVIAGIERAAKELKAGDFFLLTNSSHGGQVKDTNGDDKDGMDETWVMYDRMIVDDELYALWSRFKKGVRIAVLSDSCHSGTVLRFAPDFITGGERKRVRLMPPAINKRVYEAHKKLYNGIQQKTKARTKVKVAASVLLISGCMDNQTSADGDKNGLFTETLKKVWNNGKFDSGYRKFRDKIVALMPSDQTPNYYKVGVHSAAFEAQHPFTI